MYKIISIGTNQVREFRDAYPEVWERALRWAVVRHPYSRVISAWKYMDSLRSRDLVEFHFLPVVNVTLGKKRYELTERQKQRIFELYEADFEALGYAR